MQCGKAWWIALICAQLVRGVLAGEDKERASARPAKSFRTYTGRVEWHAMPVDFEAPHQVEQPAELKPDVIRLEKPHALDTEGIYRIAPFYLYQQPPVRPRDWEERRKQKNWLVLKLEEQKEKGSTEKRAARIQEEDKEEDTGWGWLATAVLRQQEKERAAKSAEEEEDEEVETPIPLLPTESLRQMASETQPGLIVSPSDAPKAGFSMSAVKPMLDPQEKQNLRRVAIDEGVAPYSLPSAFVSRSEEGRSLVTDRGNAALPLGGSDETPASMGNQLRRSGGAPSEVLPQTAALLSRQAPAEAAAKPTTPNQVTSFFQAERPTSAFDLSMPVWRGVDSSVLRPAPSISAEAGAPGFFPLPQENSIGFRPSRPADSGLLIQAPSASAGGGRPAPSFRTDQPGAAAPAFPTAPSWRK